MAVTRKAVSIPGRAIPTVLRRGSACCSSARAPTPALRGGRCGAAVPLSTGAGACIVVRRSASVRRVLLEHRQGDSGSSVGKRSDAGGENARAVAVQMSRLDARPHSESARWAAPIAGSRGGRYHTRQKADECEGPTGRAAMIVGDGLAGDGFARAVFSAISDWPVVLKSGQSFVASASMASSAKTELPSPPYLAGKR